MSLEAAQNLNYKPIIPSFSNATLCSYLLKIIKIIVGIVIFPLGLYWCFCKETPLKNVTFQKPMSSTDQLINQFQEDFKKFLIYIKTEPVCPRTLISDLAARFQLQKYEACGRHKIVFRSLDQEIVKIQFVDQVTPLSTLLKAASFSISHPALVNPPRNITLYLKKGGLAELHLADRECITKHSVAIVEVDEPTFKGALVWKEEAFLQSGEQILADVRKEGTPDKHLDSLHRIICFWDAIKLNISQGNQYLVTDLVPANIAIFKDRTVRIIDIQPRKTAFSIHEANSNMSRYQTALQPKPAQTYDDL